MMQPSPTYNTNKNNEGVGGVFTNVATRGTASQPTVMNPQLAFKETEEEASEPKKMAENVDQYFRDVQEVDEFQIAEEHQQACPEETANIFSRLSFWWFNPLMKTGYNKVLQLSDLYKLRKVDEAAYLADDFKKNWDKEAAKAKDHQEVESHELDENIKRKKKSKPSLIYALHKTYGFRFYMAGLLKIVYDISQLSSPILVKMIISSIRDSDTVPVYQGYLLVLGLFLLQMISTFFIQQYFHIVMSQGMRLKTGLSAAIYAKSLKLSNSARQKINSGDIINYMAIDANKLCGLVTYLHMAWSGVFQIAVCLAMLFSLIGWSTLAGVAIIVVVIPLNGAIARVVQKIRKAMLQFTGERIKLVNEAIQGIRIIKFYAWENSFIKKIMDIRNKEMWKITQSTFIGIVTSMLMTMAPLFVGVATFAIFAATGGLLDADIIFPSLSYFNLLRFPATFLPTILALLAEAKVSLDRLQNYLLADEIEEVTLGSDIDCPIVIEDGTFIWKSLQEKKEEPSKNKKAESKKPVQPTLKSKTKKKGSKTEKKKYNEFEDEAEEEETDQVTIELAEDAEEEEEVEEHAGELQFVDDKEPTTEKKDFTLQNINIQVKKGDLVVIVGLVGSGKSSLLSAIIGEMFKQGGNLQVSGNVAYVPQQAWIRNATVRDNILFGNTFNTERYYKTIEACCLENDLEILTAGDMTEIGEKGITLSGGQKQRVSLARSVYSDADIYLFDDVLSALDQHVGRSVFQNCICGLLSNKTRVLVTHQWQYLKDADHVIVVQDGAIVAQGTHSELVQSDSKFSSMLKNYFKQDKEEEKEEKEKKEEDDGEKTIKKRDGKLMSTEERAEGSVKASVYKSYIRYAGGYFVLLGILLLFTLNQASQIMTSWFLAEWSTIATQNLLPTNGTASNSTMYNSTEFFDNVFSSDLVNNATVPTSTTELGYNLPMFIGIYVALGVGSAFFMFFQELSFGFSGLRAAKRLHSKALEKIMNSPTNFFDTNPVGRIINRFSKDTESIDGSLIGTLRMLLNCIFSVLGTLILIATVSYLFIIPIIPVLLVYYFVQKYYRSTSRELKRLDSISRSPLFAHFGETLTGIATIRAYRRQEEFVLENHKLLDRNNKAYFAQLVSQRWLAFRLELVGAVVILFAALSALVGGTTAAMAGLSLSYALSVTSTASWLVRCATEAEAAMNSVERVLYYCEEIPQEAPKSIPETKPAEEWPQKGEIELRNVYFKYREELDFVLRDLSLHVNPTEKIGIVGRTGCGKSTLMQALFRITEIAQGQIVVDGVDISKIGLHDLRSKLAIIPQDPVLFSGTVRFNLDPFDEYPDQQIWQALERSHIKEKIKSLEGQLSYKVAEYGENFSIGERQLICVARAILRKTKILIMDEATANVDMQTDALLQETVRTEFSDRTVLTVAHRLNTIIDSDRIVALKAGQLAEFDTPRNLLTISDQSIFASLIDETGKNNASYLRSIVMGELDYMKELKKSQEHHE